MRILVPLPRRDYDPSEAAIPWQILRAAGHEFVFATPDGRPAQADPIMLSGEGLDYWGCIPLLKKLKLVGLVLRADARARVAHAQLVQDPAFLHPIPFAQMDERACDALLLPGGHAPGMREYLEDATLQRCVAAFFDARKPVAAVCHGVLLAARSVSAVTGKSVLHGRRTTALTWAFERNAWTMTRWFGRWWDRHYYRTYREAPGEPAGYWSVQAEVTRVLAQPGDFVDVARDAPDYAKKTSGLARDSAQDARPAHVVVDGTYVSARWPGDVHTLAQAFAQVLAAQPASSASQR